MGRVKEGMMEEEHNLVLATHYLVQLGTLEECEAHGSVYGGGHWDLEEPFWKKVMADRNRGVEGPVPWAAEMKPRKFTDLLKKAYDDHPGDGCGQCAKNMAE